jgi:hypothetical protein
MKTQALAQVPETKRAGIAREERQKERSLPMKAVIYPLAALVLATAVAAVYKTTPAAGSGVNSPAASHRPELEYWKAVNGVAPPRDPQVLFLLMAEYSNESLQGDGAESLSARLKEFGPRLIEAQKALYLSAIGLLRAQHASLVPLLPPYARYERLCGQTPCAILLIR